MDREVGVQGLRGLRTPGDAPSAVSVLALAERYGSDACLLREPDPSLGPLEEVDLLVAPSSLDELGLALVEHGFVPHPAWGRRPHRFWFGYDPARDRWLKVDAVTALVFGLRLELPLAPAAPFLARARGVGGERRLRPEDEFWTLLLHCLLDKRAIRPDHAARLAELAPAAAGAAGPGADAAGRALAGSIGSDRALALALAGSFDELAGSAGPVTRALARSTRLRVAGRRLVNGSLRRLSKLQTLLARRGLRVVLLGPDGAGKSTLAAEIVKTFPFGARRLYAGLYPAGSTKGGPLPGLRLLARLARLRSTSCVARVHQWRGRLVVFDRYTLDARLPAPAGASRKTRARRWLLARACPLPDLAVVLDAPAAILYARKGEHSLALLERQRQQYLELAERVPHAVVVDAGQGAADVRRAVTAAIWTRYGEVRSRAGAPASRASSLRDGSAA